jgi:glutamate synthase (NADPH/NADH) large chain
MTGGTVVVLGKSGDNFGAGMTGGMAFVYDEDKKFQLRVNSETLFYDQIRSDYWTNELYQIILKHYQNTASQHAKRILDGWENEKNKFIQICPKEVVAMLPQPLGFEMRLKQAN